jgi:hypothetical protein
LLKKLNVKEEKLENWDLLPHRRRLMDGQRERVGWKEERKMNLQWCLRVRAAFILGAPRTQLGSPYLRIRGGKV